MLRLIARFARVRIEDSSRNMFALNGIQRDFFGGIFFGKIFSGGILSGYHGSHILLKNYSQANNIYVLKKLKYYVPVHNSRNVIRKYQTNQYPGLLYNPHSMQYLMHAQTTQNETCFFLLRETYKKTDKNFGNSTKRCLYMM